ncbi:MAG TPA: type 4a pilus biogenesis protein PilO [Acidimicrobiia bacterium]|nr:type 4a pilus biogenesis protein PilO [Acidimicrobiia bacterium]
MNRRGVALFAVAAVAIVALWWTLVYSPRGDQLDDAKVELETAQGEQQALQAQLARLEDINENLPEIDADLAKLSGLVPPTADLAGFILGMNDLANQSGIDWISVSPTPPAAQGTGFATIGLNITVEGGFFQVLDYLNRLEDFDRLVVVEGVNVTGGSTGGEGTDGAVVDSSGLAVSMTARMFTTQQPGVATTTTTAPAATTTTTGAAQ